QAHHVRRPPVHPGPERNDLEGEPRALHAAGGGGTMSTEQAVSLVQLPQATVTVVGLNLRPGITREEWRAVLAALRAPTSGATGATDDSWADGVPDGPYALCGHQPLAEVRDWPTAGERRWLCLRCVGPVLTLADVHAGLTGPRAAAVAHRGRRRRPARPAPARVVC